jgi:hypothetical protein
VPLYRPGGDLNGREEWSHRRRSAPSLLRLLLGIGGDVSVIQFKRRSEVARAALGSLRRRRPDARLTAHGEDSGGGCCVLFQGRRKVPTGFGWAGCWATRPSGPAVCCEIKKEKWNCCWTLWAELMKEWK